MFGRYATSVLSTATNDGKIMKLAFEKHFKSES